ncbi:MULTISPECIES: DUF4406 domain-containing protein [Achromobacter]|uniref:DUF4406 domain-containing protein n=1 Tax=Achromobacter TaxID=222 RepID=UPI0023F78220|nr:DUF4406 domain-containing protein [Achromobacter anxifer]MDF8363317.1 DUF4406 domain-containing protein [Achromobacter anxifer]
MTDQNNTPHDLGSSGGGRAYIAEYFASQIRRHDFARYINSTLAADFACALAQHLSKLRAEGDNYREVIDEDPVVSREAQVLMDKGKASAPVAIERAVFGRAEVSFPMMIPGNRVYLAGPMTGKADHNFPAFHAAAERLRAFGLDVVNPADHGVVDGMGWADYMRWDIVKLAGCHSVYVLPGWEKSKGASLEVAIARALGMPLFTVEGSPIQAGASVADIRGELNGLGMMAHTALNQDANDRYNILDYLAERLLAMAGGVPMPNTPGHKHAPMYTSPGHSAPPYIADGKVGRLLDAAHAAVEILDDLSDHAAAQIASIELSNAAAAIAATERASPVSSEAMRKKNPIEKAQHEREGAA